MHARFASILLLTFPLLVACPTGDDDDASGAPDPCDGIEGVDGTSVELETFAADVTIPVHIANAGDGSDRLFVVEQSGAIIEFDATGAERRTFLDIADRTSNPPYGERGLLSVAFHPNFVTNGRFFVNYTSNAGGGTVVSEFGLTPVGLGDPVS